MGTETDWNPGGKWRPMSDAELLYRRALCKGKPYCFLMNTEFEQFSPELVEKYMKRSLAYGMFPGFFSHNASQGHYFTRPELYDRDRPLFKKYVPLCKRVAEAGWEPVTRARSSDEQVYVERFGERLPDRLQRQPRTAHRDDPAGHPGAGRQPRTGHRQAGRLDRRRHHADPGRRRRGGDRLGLVAVCRRDQVRQNASRTCHLASPNSACA